MIEQGIRMSSAIANIALALHQIQEGLRPIEKKGRNTSQNYSYAKFEDYIEGIKDTLTNAGLMLITTVKEPKRLEPRPTKYGGFQYGVEVAIVVRLFHKTGEWIEVDCYGEGQDSGDKAIYKAITGARKYGVACLFGLATKDDPEDDEDDRKQQRRFDKDIQKREGNQHRDQQRRHQEPATQPHTRDNEPYPEPDRAPPATRVTASPAEIDKAFSLAIDLIQAADNLTKLKSNFANGWHKLNNLLGKDHPKLSELKKIYEDRKSNFETTT